MGLVPRRQILFVGVSAKGYRSHLTWNAASMSVPVHRRGSDQNMSPASLPYRTLCLGVTSFSAVCSRTSTGPHGTGGPRRRWWPRKGSRRRRLPPPCCRDRPCNIRVSMPPHLLFVCAPPPLPVQPRTAVSVTGCPKFGINCIFSDVGGCIRVAIAVYTAYGGKKLPDCHPVMG